MQEALFDEGELAFDKGIFEYDTFVDGIYVFSHLDSDLARLIRFKEAVTGGDGRYEVVYWQMVMDNVMIAQVHFVVMAWLSKTLKI